MLPPTVKTLISLPNISFLYEYNSTVIIKQNIVNKQMHSNELSTYSLPSRYSINLHSCLELYASQTDSRSSCSQEEEDELFQQVESFPVLREYFKTYVYKYAKYK
jgi:hypothetical protein